MTRQVSLTLIAAFFLAFVLSGFSRAQEDSTSDAASYEDLVEYYRKSRFSDRAAKLGKDPGIAEHLAIAEAARSLVHSKTPQEEGDTLLSLQKTFTSKFNALLQNDLGRYVATEPEAVKACLRLEEATKDFSPDAIAERYRRLGTSIGLLRDYNTTLGEFDSKSEPTAKAIVADATWVNDYFSKLKRQVALLTEFERTAASDAAESNPDALASEPTLRQAMDAYEAELLLGKLDKDTSAIERATTEADAARRATDVELIQKQAVVELEAKKKLAAVARELYAAEVDFKAAEKRLATAKAKRREQTTRDAAEMERTRTELDKVGAEQERLETGELAQRARLIKYLQSARVKPLLAPFCSPGTTQASTHQDGAPKLEGLGKQPMSLSNIARLNCLAPTRPAMVELIGVANNVGNDRAGWPVTAANWEAWGDTHKGMDGALVNPCVEAQRILREHGGLLVELKMLRP